MTARTPTAILQMNGSAKHNPGRHRSRKHEPKNPSPLGDPPVYLDVERRAIWYEVIAISVPGVLTSSDRMTVELLTGLVAKMRANFAAMTAADMGKLLGCLGVLGMTPADRSKIVVHDAEPIGTFREFAA